MEIRKIILCRGIQGSGKSTFSKAWAKEDPEHRIRYSNDDIRNMLGLYWVPLRENVIRRTKTSIITEAMESYFNIIIDNMNLNPNEVKYYEGLIKDFNNRRTQINYILEFRDFKTPLEICIERDSKRENPIGEKVIRETYERYKDFYNDFKEVYIFSKENYTNKDRAIFCEDCLIEDCKFNSINKK